MKFNEIINDQYILEALDSINIDTMTEIQERAIPIGLAGNDVIGLAKTGTGKTFAYGIPIISKITNEKETQALILCPTRELSLQVSLELVKLLKYKKDILVGTIYGGESYDIQLRMLKKKPQIVVGTPGRIIDHIKRKTLNLTNINSLVLDEADEMLKMGFKDDLEFILSATNEKKQTLLFSATMDNVIMDIAKDYQKDPVIVSIKHKSLTVDSIDQRLYYVNKDNKKDLLIRLLDYYDFKSVIIFCNTKKMVDELQVLLVKNHFVCDSLHGDLKQAQRDKVMNAFKKHTLRILVCTDVAARGIDVSDLEAIINFDLPYEDEIYVHRIGRTGRAGKTGISLTLATPKEKYQIKKIEKYTKSEMNVSEIPTIEKIHSQILESLYEEIIDKLDLPIDRNYTILNRLAKKGYDPARIINALIEIELKDKRKFYNEIEEVVFKSKDNKSNNDRYRSRNRNKNAKFRREERKPKVNAKKPPRRKK